MRPKSKSKLEQTLENYRDGTTRINNESFNPFKEDFHAKLIYLIDRQAGMQQGELWQFFNQLTIEEQNAYSDDKKIRKESALLWRDKSQVNQTVNKYLKTLIEKGIIEERPEMKTGITFNPLTKEILPFEVTREGGVNKKETKPARYFLKEPLFVLLVRAFGIEDYFTGQVNFSKNKRGFEEMNKLVEQDFQNETTQNDISKATGINNTQLKEISHTQDVNTQIRKMQKVVDICQKKTRKDFLQKLTQDFEEYYAPARNLQIPLDNIYTKQPLGIDYFAVLTRFLNDRFNFEWNKILTVYSVKTKRYNYAETFLIDYTKIISTYKETGFLLDWTELKRLQQGWTKRDGSKNSIDVEFSKIFDKKIHINGNLKHVVPTLIR